MTRLPVLFLRAHIFLLILCIDAGSRHIPAHGIQDPSPISRETLPLLVLFPRTSAVASRSREDPDRALFEAVRERLVRSNRFRVLTYSPGHPLIKRALTERTLSAAELASEPLPAEARHRVARLLGATYILAITASRTSAGLQTGAQCEQATGQQDWRVLFMEQNTVSVEAGRRRLKLNDQVRVAADEILTRLGLPSESQAPRDADARRPDRSSEQKPAPADRPDADPRSRGNTQVPSDRASQNVPGNNEQPRTSSLPVPSVRPDVPALPPALPPPTGRPDFEAEAARYRQAGDLANVILSLRRAINDRPRDVALRQQLVQAYLQRQMADAAMAESERALAIAPQDPVLHRLRGDALLAKADLAGAQSAYREAIRLAPADVVAQVALGDALMNDNQFAEALKAYEQATKSDPASPLPYRRLARALAGRAAADPRFYAQSLAALEQARQRTPSADTETYREDYLALMRLMGNRLRDMVAEIQANYTARTQNKQSLEQTRRSTQDLKERAQAAADFLDRLPPAVGQEATHARYQQSAALLLQATTLLREWLDTGETRTEEALKAAQIDVLREIANATKRLDSAQKKP
ncbi:MAG: hypothetical protein RMJ43_05475 [Chloroherpetonaceae bacterium]|nr:hypothetical protein [Chthonomonadaceae bacterium]MDW8207266.1 hypothetical protein [Chloroherpetonaceae bacterium]